MEEEKANNTIRTFIRKRWLPFFVIVLVIFTLICIGFNVIKNANTNNPSISNVSKEDIEKYKQETDNYTFCELGDLVGEDVKRIKYKGFNLDFHTSDFSQNDIKQFAQECLNENIETQYQMDCCIRYRMYP